MKANLLLCCLLLTSCGAGFEGLLGGDAQKSNEVSSSSSISGNCQAEVIICPSGKQVTRDPSIGCSYDPCASGSQSNSCAQDVLECNNGILLRRDPDNNCSFGSCPNTDSNQQNIITQHLHYQCTEHLKVCSDGSLVAKDPELGCQFEVCPDEE